TQEKRPVFAHATCDQPWLDVGRAKLNGRFATIPVQVPSVPNRPGETLQATVHVTANGNQRFQVPLTLSVAGASPFAFAEPVAAMAVPALQALPAAGAGSAVMAVLAEPSAVPVMAVSAVPVPAGDPFAFSGGAVQAVPVATMPG